MPLFDYLLSRRRFYVMSSNKGYYNEQLLVEALNGKRYSEINHNLQTMMRDMFAYQNEEEIIEAEQIKGLYKPDISITYKGQKVNVSVKSGSATMVHGESIRTFIQFLRENGISSKTMKIILLFHFGDDTLDGSGPVRHNTQEIFSKLSSKIKEANAELNANRAFIEKFVDRVMYRGIFPDSPVVDYIYFGSPEYGTVVSKKQIATYINMKNWKYFNYLHIGPIFFKPHARYAYREVVSTERREKVHFYWPNLGHDLDKINKRYSF